MVDGLLGRHAACLACLAPRGPSSAAERRGHSTASLHVGDLLSKQRRVVGRVETCREGEALREPRGAAAAAAGAGDLVLVFCLGAVELANLALRGFPCVAKGACQPGDRPQRQRGNQLQHRHVRSAWASSFVGCLQPRCLPAVWNALQRVARTLDSTAHLPSPASTSPGRLDPLAPKLQLPRVVLQLPDRCLAASCRRSSCASLSWNGESEGWWCTNHLDGRRAF